MSSPSQITRHMLRQIYENELIATNKREVAIIVCHIKNTVLRRAKIGENDATFEYTPHHSISHLFPQNMILSELENLFGDMTIRMITRENNKNTFRYTFEIVW